jgi:hypothetical protein
MLQQIKKIICAHGSKKKYDLYHTNMLGFSLTLVVENLDFNPTLVYMLHYATILSKGRRKNIGYF